LKIAKQASIRHTNMIELINGANKIIRRPIVAEIEKLLGHSVKIVKD